MKVRNDMYPGARWGNLLVLEKVPGPGAIWLMFCDCGKKKALRASDVRAGQLSCGHDRRHRNSIEHHHEYKAWDAMIRRCHVPTCAQYKNYGARGIGVCQSWRVSFAAFYADVGPRPSPRHSLGRINNDGHYQPGNVRWELPVEQQRNTRNNRLLTFKGKTQCMAAWAEEVGISLGALSLRLNHYGHSVERALTQPLRRTAR